MSLVSEVCGYKVRSHDQLHRQTTIAARLPNRQSVWKENQPLVQSKCYKEALEEVYDQRDNSLLVGGVPIEQWGGGAKVPREHLFKELDHPALFLPHDSVKAGQRYAIHRGGRTIVACGNGGS